MGSGRRLHAEGAAQAGGAPRGRGRRPSSSGDLYTLFRDSLQGVVLEAFLNSGAARRLGVDAERLAAVVREPVSEHFHSYLCCSICYEPALLCAVGTCSHVMCYLCVLRLKNFYEQECDVYQCPYCKQDSDCLVLCANPFFAHMCVEGSMYAHEGSPELPRSGLEALLGALSLGGSFSRTLLSQPKVSMRALQDVFLSSARALKRCLPNTYDSRMQQLVRKAQRLSVTGREQRDPFRDVYGVKHPRPRLEGDAVVVSDQCLLFENSSIYMVFRLMTSALCWMPDCKEQWYTARPPASSSDLGKALDKLHQHRSASYESLNRHLKGAHGVAFCETCQCHFREKKFICEMPVYRSEDIKRHVRAGDPDRVPPIPAHVQCSACRRFQWDRAELKRHAREEHFLCSICDSEGWVCDIFTDYPSFFEHSKAFHYPCEEEDCMFVVFPDDLQLQLHYMSKHPHRPRVMASRKLKAQPQAPDPKPPAAKTFKRMSSIPGPATAWDGTIRVVPDDTSPQECDKDATPVPEELSAEFAEWLRKRSWVTDPALRGFGKTTSLLETFAQTLICVNIGSSNREFDFDTFSVKCARRVLNDLRRALEILRSGKLPARSELWQRLPADFHRHVQRELLELGRRYSDLVEASLAGDVPAAGAPTLLDVVKESVSRLVTFVYSINFHVEFESLLGVAKCACLEHRASPNAVMLLNALEELVPLTNKILVKQSLDWVGSVLDGAFSSAAETKMPAASLTAIVKKKSRQGTEFSLDMLNPDSDLSKEIDQHKQNRRVQQAGRGRASHMPTKVVARDPETPRARGPQSAGPRSAGPLSSGPLSAGPPSMSPPAGDAAPDKDKEKESSVVVHESYIASVEESFKSNVYTNFYSAMVSVIRHALTANETKYNASAPVYRLREPTRQKINQMMMSGNRRFTALSEFVPMQMLEALEALEPEYHRLVKEAKRVGAVDELAKTWSTRCAHVLRRCRVEHLEVIDYYLNARAGAMALRSEAEFPSLGDQRVPAASRTRRNYAQALNVASTSRVVFSESDFPALGKM